MGMFGWIHLENKIPDPDLREREWQTKSLENFMLHYRVTADGELIVKRQEFEAQEDPGAFLGMKLKVVREWEETVDHHGVVETYNYRRLPDDSSHSVTYLLYFTYGRLTSLERSERSFPPVKPLPRLEDLSHRRREAIGDLEVDFPESVELLRLHQEGSVYVLSVRFDGYLHAHPRAGGIEIGGTRFTSPEDQVIHSSMSVRHLESRELEILAQNRRGRGDHLLIVAPAGYLSDKPEP
jgi:hypothetical protein